MKYLTIHKLFLIQALYSKLVQPRLSERLLLVAD